VFNLEDRLSNLDEKKKTKIINSAMEEFSKNTYEKASTNRIVEKAGISKGSLFNYFESKKKLYEYIKVLSIVEIADAIVEEVNWEEPDLFKRIKEITLIKLKFFRKYPYIVGFNKRIHSDKSIEELKEIYEEYVPNIYQKIYSENIDFSKFRDDVGIKEVMNIFIWTFEKLGEQYLNKVRVGEKINADEMEKEVDKYVEVLRKGFYK
jgi:AcrR family transcriptional regulator